MSMGLEGARPPNKISSSHSKISPISRPAVWRVSRKKNQTNPRRANLAPTLNLRSPIPPRTFDRLRGRPRARPEAPALGGRVAAQAIRRRRVAPRHQNGAKDDHSSWCGGFDARKRGEPPNRLYLGACRMQREHDGELAEPRRGGSGAAAGRVPAATRSGAPGTAAAAAATAPATSTSARKRQRGERRARERQGARRRGQRGTGSGARRGGPGVPTAAAARATPRRSRRRKRRGQRERRQLQRQRQREHGGGQTQTLKASNKDGPQSQKTEPGAPAAPAATAQVNKGSTPQGNSGVRRRRSSSPALTRSSSSRDRGPGAAARAAARRRGQR